MGRIPKCRRRINNYSFRMQIWKYVKTRSRVPGQSYRRKTTQLTKSCILRDWAGVNGHSALKDQIPRSHNDNNVLPQLFKDTMSRESKLLFLHYFLIPSQYVQFFFNFHLLGKICAWRDNNQEDEGYSSTYCFCQHHWDLQGGIQTLLFHSL